MSGLDIAIVVIVGVAFIAASALLIYRKVKKKGGCGCCDCGCAACDKCNKEK